jgi:hypothetical protein
MFNGWEFLILNPFEKNFEDTQEIYISEYNKSYNKFLSEICIPNPCEIISDNYTFLHFIDCNKEQDIINNDSNFEFKFKKSVFFDKKITKIKRDLKEHYSNYSINVNRIYKCEHGFIIELISIDDFYLR